LTPLTVPAKVRPPLTVQPRLAPALVPDNRSGGSDMSRNSRIAVLVGALAIAVVGFVVAGGGSSEKASHTSGHAYIYIVGGKPKGGVQTLTYNKGQQVVFTVTSDVADEVHVHGFNIEEEVPNDGSVTFSFPATDQGGHVIELEGRGEQIANLEVR
jgi:hypothetical protein